MSSNQQEQVENKQEKRMRKIEIDLPTATTSQDVTLPPQQTLYPTDSQFFTLEPKEISFKKSSESFPSRNSLQKEKERVAGEFVKRVRKDKRHFEGRMFLIKQQQERERRKKENDISQEKSERSMQNRRRKLGQIFENLEEYEERKKKRKEQIQKFRKDLYRLQNQKPLYQIRQEEYIQKYELPVILQRQEKLQQVKQSRKPIDWQREMSQFHNRIFELKQQRPPRLSPTSTKPSEPQPYKSRFYYKASESHLQQNSPEHLKTQVQQRRKRYSQEVKNYIQPTLHSRVQSNNSFVSTPKISAPPRQVQLSLGNQYLKYCKGFSDGKRHKTEKSIDHKIARDEQREVSEMPKGIQTQHLSHVSPERVCLVDRSMGSIETVEDQQNYLNDIRIKLDILRCMVDQ